MILYIEQNKIVKHAVCSKTLAMRAKSYDDIHNTFPVPSEIFTTDSFASLIMENIVALSAWSIFPVKLFCCFAFGSVSSACCLLMSSAIFYNNY